MLEKIGERLQGTIDDTEFDRRLDHMARFEQELHDDGALILKFWIHLPRKALKKRAERPAHKASGGLDVVDRLMSEAYDDVRPLSERVLRRTESSGSPWHIVEASDARYRELTVAKTIRSALLERLARPPARAMASDTSVTPAPEHTVLDAVDLGAHVVRAVYKTQRDVLQERLRSSPFVLEKRAPPAWRSSKGGTLRAREASFAE